MRGYLTWSQNFLILLKPTHGTDGYLTRSQNLLILLKPTHGTV
jgi:hypothetical protein